MTITTSKNGSRLRIALFLLTVQITCVVGSSLVSTCWTSPQPHWDVGMLGCYSGVNPCTCGAMMSLLVFCVCVCVCDVCVKLQLHYNYYPYPDSAVTVCNY